MSIEDQRDLAIEAIATLLHGALNAEDGLGEGSVIGIYDEPMSLDTIANAKLPALCVYRTSDTSESASAEIVETVTVQLDLILRQSSATTGAKRGMRWPALVAAWRCMRRALMVGHHPSVSDDARLLDDVDINIERASFDGRMYGFADSGPGVFPVFRGTFQYTQQIDHRVNKTLIDLERVRSIFEMGTEEDLPTEDERTAQVNVEFEGPWPSTDDLDL